jgi:uncharacterized membrane protein
MSTFENSIEVNIPAQQLYAELTRFEDYARFMDNVNQVQKLDDDHLRWTTTMANRPVEWDSVITRSDAERRIAWRANGVISNAGRLEVQAVGEDSARVVLSLEIESGKFPGAMAGDNDAETSQHVRQSLARLKSFVEGKGAYTEEACELPGPGGVVGPASTSGSPTEVLEDEPNESGPLGNIGGSR